MEQISFYFDLFKRSWWIIALCTLGMLLVSLFLSYQEMAMYRASAMFLVSPNLSYLEQRDIVGSMNPLDDQSLAGTYAEIFQSDQLFQEAGVALQLTPEALEDYEKLAVVLPRSNVLELSVTGPNPYVVAMLANSIGNRSISYIDDLYQIYRVTVLDSAEPPDAPFAPNPRRTAIFAVVLGAMIGVIIAFGREQFRVILNRYNNPQTSTLTDTLTVPAVTVTKVGDA